MLINIKRLCLSKAKKMIHMWKFPNLEEYPLNIDCMLHILHMPVCLHEKVKCNIVAYKLNVYKTSTKEA